MRRRLEIAISAAAVVLAFLYARYSLFSSFQPYDDEGYMLLSLSHYASDGGLYTKTFSQYGPFFFQAERILHGVLGQPVTHDGGRIVTLICWYLGSLFGGFFVYRISRNLPLAAAAVMSCVILGKVLANEPGHPQSIVFLLLPGAACLALWPNRWGLLLLGAIGAALSFTKINVGIFFLVALAHALLCLLPSGGLRTLGLGMMLLYAAIFPPVLMREHLFEWAGGYCAWIVLCTAAVFIAFGWPATRISRKLPLWPTAGALGAGAIIVLAAGLPIRTLIDGTLIAPLKQPGAFWVPWDVNLWQIGAAVAILAATFWLRKTDGDHWRWLAALIAVVLLIGVPTIGLVLTLPLLPFLLLDRNSKFENVFPSLFLADLAVTQALQAYPVAASQVAIAAVPALLAAFIPLARKPIAAYPLILVVAAGILGSDFKFFGYRDSSLDLAGARKMHIPSEEAARYRSISNTIRGNCDILFTMPGMGSFNLWSGVPTPNGQNLTAWMQILDRDQQQEILNILQAHPQSCVVENPELVDFWKPGPLSGPLPNYIRTAMPLAAEVGPYRIHVSPARRGTLPAPR